MDGDRHRQGSGSVTQRADGRFWARGPRSAGRPSLGVFDTEAEAEEERAAFAAKLRAQGLGSLPGATVRSAGEHHLREHEADGAPALASLKSRWKHVCAAPWIDDALTSLRQPAVDTWARALRRPRGSLAPATVDAVLALLSSICARAVREGHLTANPCAGLRLPQERRTEEPWTYLLPEEQDALLAAPLPPEEHALIAVALGTGLREGELFALRVADAHLGGARPYAVVRYGGQGQAPKGGKIRSIPLFGHALRALRAWLPRLATWARRNPRGLVFPGPKGGARDVGHPLRRAGEDGWAAALELAGILRGGSAAHRHDGRVPRWHDLRHTCGASLVCGWWGERWRLEDVRELLRHSSVQVTERYAHLAPSVVHDLASRTSGVQVGYGAERGHGESAAIRVPIALVAQAAPAKPYFHGGKENPRRLVAIEGAGTPPVPRVSAAELCRAALEAAARRDPHRERLLVDACAAALGELELEQGPVVDLVTRRRRGSR